MAQRAVSGSVMVAERTRLERQGAEAQRALDEFRSK